VLAAVRKNGSEIVRIDPRTNAVVTRLRLDRPFNTIHFDYHIAAGYGSIWVTEHANDVLLRIDPTLTRVVKRTRVPGTPFGIALGFGSAWVPEFQGYEVARVSAKTNKITARFPATGPTAVTIGAGSVWVLAHRADEVLRIDPKANRVIARVPLKLHATPGGAERMAYGEGALWVSDDGGSGLVRVDPQTNRQVAEILMPKSVTGAFSVAVGGGSVWVGGDNGYLVRIDPKRNAVTGMLRRAFGNRKDGCGPGLSGPGCTHSVVYAAGAVWVGSSVSTALLRIAPK
jgi:streptogramin lyase